MADTFIRRGGPTVGSDVVVSADQSTIEGDGTTSHPLHAVPGGVPVAVDGVTIQGDGTLGDPLHVVPDSVPVATDGQTIAGNGTTGDPLRATLDLVLDNPATFAQGQATARLQDVANGNAVLSVGLPNPETVLAADLNAAGAGSFQRISTTRLVNAAGAVHEWAAFVPVLVPSESVADPDVGPPVVVGTPQFADGFLVVEITFDTDAGVTKTYAPGDTVSVEVKVSSTDTLLGYTIAPATKTYLVA